jgi:hypothetical protein
MGHWEARGSPQVQTTKEHKSILVSRNNGSVTIEQYSGSNSTIVQYGRRIKNRGFWKDAKDEHRYSSTGKYKYKKIGGIVLPVDLQDDNIIMVFTVVLSDLATAGGMASVSHYQVMQVLQHLARGNKVTIDCTTGTAVVSSGDAGFNQVKQNADAYREGDCELFV